MRLFRIAAAALAVALAPLSALAAPRDAVMNKEGFWAIDVDEDVCAGSMTLQGGAIFMLRGAQGKVSFGIFSPTKAFARGEAGRIETEAYGFDFEPSYGEDAKTLFFVGDLDARSLAALRLARQARVLVDGKPVVSMTLEGTGFEGALEGVVACSNGESGWWGAGVGSAQAGEASPPLNKEGIWSLAADGDGCVSTVTIEGGMAMVLIAVNGGRDLMVGAGSGAGFKRGRKGVFETDAYSFAFKPDYTGKDYVQLDRFLDSQAVFALRRAKSLAIMVDGEEVISAEVADTGLPALLDDLGACAAGRKGWWGEGAKLR